VTLTTDVALRKERERRRMSTPDPAAVEASQLTDFIRFCEGATGRSFADQTAFHQFSVAEYRRFWSLFLSWSGLTWSGEAEPVCSGNDPEAAVFFPRLSLSYAENLLHATRYDADEIALTVRRPGLAAARVTRHELAVRVAACARALATMGVEPGDRVVAIARNSAETVVASLAVTSLGATFSVASPDMGASTIVERFRQLHPSILMTVLEPSADHSAVPLSQRVKETVAGLPSLVAVVALDDGPAPAAIKIPIHRLAEFVGAAEGTGTPSWQIFPFNHPLFVLFSSGTTGRPKCIVHGAGGTLIEHVKEHRLHVDLRPGETLFFHTSAAWMMWNWQLSALASGVHVVLYDGPIMGPETLWELVADEQVNVFGTSPPYLRLCEEHAFRPESLPLGALRSILSTGSILADKQYDWVAGNVGPVPLQSISGGTDIVGCFVLGSPNLPVYRGEAQCRSLGLDVQALPRPGAEESPVGELVCSNPFPSRPVGLYGDTDGALFHRAYFEQNPGVWTHGDLIEFADDGAARMHGRSDGVMNVGGARIGPAEIYAVIDDFDEIQHSMAVELSPDGCQERTRIVLLVVMRDEGTLNDTLRAAIRRRLARHASAAHVPALIVEVDDLPTTHNGKRSEHAARDAVNGLSVTNGSALQNPACLQMIRERVAAAASEVAARSNAFADTASTLPDVQAIWEGVLDVAPVQPDDNFFDLGGSSLTAIRMFRRIYEDFGRELALSTLLDAPTPRAFAKLLDGAGGGALPLLIRLNGATDGQPLFLVHNGAGEVLTYRPLALALGYDGPLYAIRVRGLDEREQPQRRVEEMAEEYLEQVRREQPSGPYSLIGHSLGGLIALEMARRLDHAGEQVDFLGIIDSDFHESCLPLRQRIPFELQRLLRRTLLAVIAPREKLIYHARRKLRRLPGVRSLDPEVATPSLQRVREASMEAFRTYRPQNYRGSATFFQAKVRRIKFVDPHPACSLDIFARVVEGGLTVVPVPGGHTDLLRRPHVDELARRIMASLTTGRQSPRHRLNVTNG
jgi:acetoacetyl-CoA synthetase